jgi:2,4-dienoyl-CoA reductase-like NADH-dependent reductase (Old Yellow Enzyme family)/thioredoxin reductase
VRAPLAPGARPAQPAAPQEREDGGWAEFDRQSMSRVVRSTEPDLPRHEALGPPEHGDRLADHGRIGDPGRPDAVAGGQLGGFAGQVARPFLTALAGAGRALSRRERERGKPSDDDQRARCEEGGASDAALLSTFPAAEQPTKERVLEHLFSPLQIGAVELPNRIVSTAHQTTLVHDHLPTDDFVAYHEARARGGAGLIVIEATAVDRSGLLTRHTLAGFDEAIVPGLARVREAAHAHGTRLFLQLLHGGREQIASRPRPPALAPSEVPSLRFHVEPRALSAEQIEEIVDGHARAAANAAAAGLDGVEISGAHNYLVAQFFTPELNRREDEWAESTRFVTAVLEAVRGAAPRLAVGIRLSADSEAAQAVAGELAGLVDYLSLAVGESSTYRGSTGIVPPPPVPENVIGSLTDPFRVGPPLIATSRIVDPAEGDGLIAEGRCDAVGMTRALITDPDMPRKAREGRLDDVIRCIGCNACIAHYHAGTPIACAQNPRTGREARLPRPEPAARRRRIVVVGAGPAGLAAASESHAAGHDVVVLERGRRLGGQLALAGAAPMHEEVSRSLRRNYERLLQGVDVRFVAEADEEVVAGLEPDAVVVVTGARPYEPGLALDGVETVQSWDVLAGTRPRSARIVVADWGGDASGLAAAEVLGRGGNDVTVAVGSAALGESLHQYQRNVYAARLYRAGIRLEHHLELTGAQGGRVGFRNLFAPELEIDLPADVLVLALGRVPEHGLAQRLAARGLDVHEAGDCLGPRSAEEAILEGTLAARAAQGIGAGSSSR